MVSMRWISPRNRVVLRTPALDQRPSGGGVRSQTGRAPRPGVRALPSGVFGPTYPRRGRAYTAAKRGDDGSARWSRPRRSAWVGFRRADGLGRARQIQHRARSALVYFLQARDLAELLDG